MKAISPARGQSTAEYAILFAIVIGAAIAMQQYVGSRLRGAVRGYADQYTDAAKEIAPVGALKAANVAAFGGDPDRTTTSSSASDLTLDTSTTGTVQTTSGSQSLSKFGASTGGTPGTPGGPTSGPGGPVF